MRGADDGGVHLTRRRVVLGWLLAVPGSAGLAAVLVPLRAGGGPGEESVLFLGLTVLCALVGGLGPALGAAVIGFLLLNYWFTAPLHTLAIDGVGNLVTLVVFIAVSLGVSSVVASATRRRQLATEARDEAATLAMLNRTLLAGEYDVEALVGLVQRTLGVDVRLGEDRLVVDGASLTPAQERILHGFGTHLVVLREREELARQTRAAHELEAANRMRTALLTAVSHDLRTPLAAIRTAAETMRIGEDRLASDDRAVLVATIEEATGRLARILTDLLDLSRLQTGALEPVSRPIDTDKVTARALLELPDRERVQVSDDLPAVLGDAGLLQRVLVNLLGNALRYADHVTVSGHRAGRRVVLEVADDGPGVAADLRSVMFEPFQRLGDTPAGDGLGLGLAVARGLTEIQGGTLTAHDSPGGGLAMRLELPGVAED